MDVGVTLPIQYPPLATLAMEFSNYLRGLNRRINALEAGLGDAQMQRSKECVLLKGPGVSVKPGESDFEAFARLVKVGWDLELSAADVGACHTIGHGRRVSLIAHFVNRLQDSVFHRIRTQKAKDLPAAEKVWCEPRLSPLQRKMRICAAMLKQSGTVKTYHFDWMSGKLVVRLQNGRERRFGDLGSLLGQLPKPQRQVAKQRMRRIGPI